DDYTNSSKEDYKTVESVGGNKDGEMRSHKKSSNIEISGVSSADATVITSGVPISCSSRITKKKSNKSDVADRTCNYCFKTFSRKDTVKAHLGRKHCKAINRGESLNPIPLEIEKQVSQSILKPTCNFCGKVYRTKVNLEKHLLLHTGKNRLACTKCSKKLMSKSELKSHMMQHFGVKASECKVCSQWFKNQEVLQTHMLSHKECDSKGDDMNLPYSNISSKNVSRRELSLLKNRKASHHIGGKFPKKIENSNQPKKYESPFQNLSVTRKESCAEEFRSSEISIVSVANPS
ncbi:unnamed protein product, partial [Meganyctiphanes norvegica]